MAQSSAAVVDLSAFRRLRQARAAASAPPAAPRPAPVFIVWVPIWYLG